MNYRNTGVDINLSNIRYNVNELIKNYNNYKYYIGVVKADSYGHNTNKVVKAIIDGGCNYLAVSSLEEALIIRKDFNVPILCLGLIDCDYLNIAQENSIDITVTNFEYLRKIKDYKLNIHIKIDTGMNRLGVKDKEEFDLMVDEIKNSNLYLKGIYTHIYDSINSDNTLRQIDRFRYMINDIDLKDIDIVHIAQSDTLVNYDKIDICNGCRLGIAMYGLNDNELELRDTFSLYSEIIEIKKLSIGETVGYGGIYKALKDEIIGIVSIGYADGINRKLTGSYVIINDKEYQIIGNICMDMLMVEIDDTVRLYDKVYLYKNIEHIKKLSKYLDTIPYEVICGVSKRVPRNYIE